MIIVFNCPGCGAILRMKEQYGGQRGRCPHCQGAITVPAIETDVGMDLLPLDGAAATPAPTMQPPSQTPSAQFSLGSRFSQAGQPSTPASSDAPASPFSLANRSPASGPAAARSQEASLGGDSNIGLAPLEDRAVKPSAAAPTSHMAARSPAADSGLGLAPLEDAAAKAIPAAIPKAKPLSEEFKLAPSESVSGKSAPAVADDVERIICAKCGAKMRMPPNAAGKQVVCPKCKNKQRVPDRIAEPTASTTKTVVGTETISLGNRPQPAADLSSGMLDMLDDSAAAGGFSAETAEPAALATPKRGGRSAKPGTILGLPSIAVYAGAAALTLIFALGLVFLLGGFDGGSTQVAQSLSSNANVAPAPVTNSPTPNQPASQPPATTAMPPQATPAAVAPATASPRTMPSGSSGSSAAPPEAPVSGVATPAAAPVADPGAWRKRIPIVRLIPDGNPRPGEAAGIPAQPGESSQWVSEVIGAETQINETLPQVLDPETARSVGPAWAEATARGLDAVRKLRRSGGVPPPPAANEGTGNLFAAARAAAQKREPETIAQTEAEMQRISQIPGAMVILEDELRKLAQADPASALAEALAERRVTSPAGTQK